MAKYNMESHYSHEVDEKYKEGWESIFGKKTQEAEPPKEEYTPEVVIRAEDSLP